TEAQASQLEPLGFVCDPPDTAWDKGYENLEVYKAEHGDCRVPGGFVAADGHKLGSWVALQRQERKVQGLTEPQAAQLEALGFVWDPLDAAWDKGYEKLEAYETAHGHCLVPPSF
ncbi:helicase associated domain-containing protein, partial [Pelagophyceae sp. CCMP2097]